MQRQCSVAVVKKSDPAQTFPSGQRSVGNEIGVFQDRSVKMILICYADAVDDYFQQIRSGSTLPSQSVRQLVESGFVIIPGPTSGDLFNELTAAYDEVMA